MPIKNKHGMYIKMQVGKNKLTAAQKEFGDMVRKEGYHTVVCYSSIEAVKAIVDYFYRVEHYESCERFYGVTSKKGD